MAEPIKEGLNESYYGPSIPPPEAVTAPRRSPYNLICAIFKVFTTFLIVVGVVVLILWLIYQPSDIKVYVEDATLSRFELATNNNTLYFNLTLAMSFRNPNKKVGIHYEKIESMAFYDGARFAYHPIHPFHQHRKNTTILHPNFNGQALLLGSGSGSPPVTFSREKGEGFFYVSVKLYTRVRLRMIIINSVEYTPEIDCDLRLPAPSNATSLTAGFTRTKCEVGTFA